MLDIRRHEANDYAVLPDIDAAGTGTITDGDRLCLDELGEYLIRNKANHRFGASLLHRHFLVNQGETFVQSIDLRARSLTMRPVLNAASDLVPVNLQFDEPTNHRDSKLVGLEFTSPENVIRNVAPISGSDVELLLGLGNILRNHDKTGRLGLRLLFDDFIADGEVLAETCDPIERCLTSTVASANDPKLAQAVPTIFTWEERVVEDGSAIISQNCPRTCWPHVLCVPGYGGVHDKNPVHDKPHAEHPGI
jgi:hypothetical protein